MIVDDRLINGEPYWAAYLHSKGSKLGLPISGTFELTPRCNFNCKMCYIHQPTNRPELNADEWLEIGEAAVKKGMLFLLLTGGEPLIRSDFPKIYCGLKDMGLVLSVNTNGSLIDDELFELFVKNPPNRLNISLYGGSEEAYERLCGNAKFSGVAGNIRRLHEAGVPIRINASITPYNVSEIEAIHAFARSEGLGIQASAYMYPPVRIEGSEFGAAPHRFTAEDAAKHMLECREQIMSPEQLIRSIDGIGDEHEECTGSESKPMHCRAGRTAFWITWDGRILPCGMFPCEGYNVQKRGFEEAWELTRADANELELPAECMSCSHRKDCVMCAACGLAETGNLSKPPEYVCTFTKTFHDLIRQKYCKEEINENK